MNKKVILIGLFLGLLLVGNSVFASIGYERIPSGYTIHNPVSFNVSFTHFPDICSGEAPTDFWTIWFKSVSEELEFFSDDRILPSIKNHLFVETLPYGAYDEVRVGCCDTETCFVYGDLELEGMFEIVNSPAPTFFSADGDDMMLASVALIGELFTDVLPALVAGLGMSLGLTYVIPKVIAVLKNLG